MASSPPEQWGRESDEISRVFCGHVNFPEMNGGISVYRGTKSNNRGLVITNNTFQKCFLKHQNMVFKTPN